LKRRQSKNVGGKVRPTTSKVLESLAAILRPRLEGSAVLDLFAGTGRVGLRLLEDGADSVVFVEGHRKVGLELRRQLREHPRREDLAVVIGPIPNVLEKVRGRFELAVCDPPYDWNQPESLFSAVGPLLVDQGLLVVEHHHKTIYPLQDGWEPHRVEKFGESRLSFFVKVGNLSLSIHEPDHKAQDQKDAEGDPGGASVGGIEVDEVGGSG